LCGNKSDLDNDRVVTYDEGKQLAEEYGVEFFETSALTGMNVEKMFYGLSTTIKRKRIDEFEGSGAAPATTEQSAKGGESSQPINLGAGQATEEGAKTGCC
jgi:GTPase SAR1 family protein